MEPGIVTMTMGILIFGIGIITMGYEDIESEFAPGFGLTVGGLITVILGILQIMPYV